MNSGNLILQSFVRVKEVIPAERLDMGTGLLALNSAIQDTYLVAVRADPDFFTKTIAFSGTSLTLPADFYQVRLAEVPAAFRGGARNLMPRDAEFMNANYVLQGTSADPVVTISGTVMEIAPSSTGTLHYLWKPPLVTDFVTEITETGAGHLALIPNVYEEDIALSMEHQLLMRLSDDKNPLDLGAEQIQGLVNSMEALENMWTPENLYGTEVNRPA